ISVELDNAEWQVYLEKLGSLDYQIGRNSWAGDYNDAYNFLALYRDADSSTNETGWENAEYVKLLDSSQTETNAEKRKEILKSAETILMDELPIAPVYFYTNTWVQKDNLKDVVISGLGEAQLKWAYFE
ncbi:MAG TPA: peptide ABC transporter substrate-binding protein, partial [Niallia sp.]|nr:peptide ABC transporter substrate-binding protein [Niallia sp.]